MHDYRHVHRSFIGRIIRLGRTAPFGQDSRVGRRSNMWPISDRTDTPTAPRRVVYVVASTLTKEHQPTNQPTDPSYTHLFFEAGQDVRNYITQRM